MVHSLAQREIRKQHWSGSGSGKENRVLASEASSFAAIFIDLE